MQLGTLLAQAGLFVNDTADGSHDLDDNHRPSLFAQQTGQRCLDYKQSLLQCGQSFGVASTGLSACARSQITLAPGLADDCGKLGQQDKRGDSIARFRLARAERARVRRARGLHRARPLQTMVRAPARVVALQVWRELVQDGVVCKLTVEAEDGRRGVPWRAGGKKMKKHI